jgi:hydroxypyruvate reductase
LSDLERLHRDARGIFDYALSSVDPRQAVVDFCRTHLKTSSSSPIYAIAIGKAATSMAVGLEQALGDGFTAGLISSPDPPLPLKRWRSFVGGHPLPNRASLEAARAAFALLDEASAERSLVVFLISGGGSAMLEWPIKREISLEDLRSANQTLITCGARINEVNAVRRGFSAVKGGALARRAPYAQMMTLIVSDTNRGDEASVASGPTLSPALTAPSAIDVIEHYKLEHVLPASIMKSVLQASPPVRPHTPGTHHVLLGNWTAVEAAARKAVDFGFTCVTREDICEQPIEQGCDLLLSGVQGETDICEISGGEFSCPVRGDGRGGRNLETVLRCALKLDSNRPPIVVLSAGTDGVDGNSPCAGAIADQTTIERARRDGLDPDHFLARSDSYAFFDQLDPLISGLILTGPTGTNVRDLRIVFKSV